VAALFFVVVGFASSVFFDFGDIILTFFLAWLIAFVLSPIVEGIGRLVPRLPRVVTVAIVYLALLLVLGVVVALVAEALARSITDFVAQIPTRRSACRRSPRRSATAQQFGLKVTSSSRSTG
jgi:predicted PurR-regulated permease PerM